MRSTNAQCISFSVPVIECRWCESNFYPAEIGQSGMPGRLYRINGNLMRLATLTATKSAICIVLSGDLRDIEVIFKRDQGVAG